MNSFNYKQELASHIRNRNAIKQMYQQKHIQMLPKIEQLLSEMIEKPLLEKTQKRYDLMKNELTKEGYSEFRYVSGGQQGQVLIAKEILTKKRFAIKGIKIRDSNGSIHQKEYTEAQQEKEMLLKCRGSPFVSNLIKTIEGQRFTFLILAECQGTLKELIDSIPSKKLNELSAIKYSKDIAEGLHYIHSKNCIVNDLKLDNILIDYNGNAVVSDFGFAQVLPCSSGYSLQKYMGNFYFQAPENCCDPQCFQGYIDEYKKINIQTKPNPSQRSEACSLGYLIYTMITAANDLLLKKHLPLDYDQDIKTFKYQKQLRYIIDGLTKFAPRERLPIEEVLILLKGIISFEFDLDQKFVELISEKTQEESNQLNKQIEYIQNFNNKYYPIIKNELSLLEDLQSSDEEIWKLRGYSENLEDQIYSLKEIQVQEQSEIKELKKIIETYKIELQVQESKIKELQKAKENSQKQLKDQESKIKEIEETKKNTQKQLQFQDSKIKEIEETKKKLLGQLEVQELKINQLEEIKENSQKQFQLKIKELEEIKQNSLKQIQVKESKIKDMQEIIQYNSQVFQVQEQKIEGLENRIKDLQTRVPCVRRQKKFANSFNIQF